MSAEEFVRRLRDDIVDTTRKMVEDGTASTSNQSSSVDERGKGKMKKQPMEFIPLELEESYRDKPIVARGSECEDDEPPPPGTPDLKQVERKRKNDSERKETSKDKEKKKKEPNTKNGAMGENEAKEASKGKEKSQKEVKSKNGARDEKDGEKKLAELKGMIKNVRSQIVELKQSTVPNAKNRSKATSISSADDQKVSKKLPHSSADSFSRSDLDEERKLKEEKRAAKQQKRTQIKAERKMQKNTANQILPEPKSTVQTSKNIEMDDLPHEHQLLLTLFMLSSKGRSKFIENLGLEFGLLQPHPVKKHVVLVNENHRKVSEELFAAGLKYITNLKSTKQNNDSAELGSQVGQKKTKTAGQRTFAYQVSYLLNNGKQQPVEEYKPELILKEDSSTDLDSFVASLVTNGTGYLVEGLLRVNSRNNAQAFVDDPHRKANIYIHSIALRQCAMDGDRVRVFVMNRSAQAPPTDKLVPPTSDTDVKRNTDVSLSEDTMPVESTDELESAEFKNNFGFVVAILEKRHKRQCVGKFLPLSAGKKHYRMFAPRDMRIPPMKVLQHDLPNAFLEPNGGGAGDADVIDPNDVIYQAEIVEWHDEVPVGTILRPIGKCDSLEVENEAILVEYNLDVTPYEDSILAQLPPLPYRIPEEELVRREDLRGECVFTIDPATARDLDDALSCKVLSDGNYEIVVHISDVTYFLHERSDLDELVKLRATSIYMVDAVHHMLPKQLCNTCSLLPGQDKLAFSVIWTIRPDDASVLSTRFTRSVINSCAQLSYEHAQLMLDNASGALDEERLPEILHGHTASGLRDIVNRLQSIAVQIRKRRMDDGCLKINQPKLTFRLDPATGRPLDYGVYQLRASNEMIEDFMLLANMSVAEKISSSFPAISLLRNHRPPAGNMMKQLARNLGVLGHTFAFHSSKAIRESMEAIIDSAEHPDAASSVLNVLLSKPMTRANYFCSSFSDSPQDHEHFALAAQMYTHFTSPIRRYADCLVHRVLAASIEVGEVPQRSPDELQRLASICNEKKYNAKLAGDASSQLYFRHWLRMVGEHETMAAVMGCSPQSIDLVLIHTGIAVRVGTKKLSATSSIVVKPMEPVDSFLLVPKDTSIPSLVLKLFAKVRVTIKVVNDAIVVTSVLPIVAAPSSTHDSNTTEEVLTEKTVTDLCDDMASARVY
ncbi:DIS3-like exonuclease 2 [Anopheles bellator]|uniref:DIS3-like exonuclease 2 n=1 Tax=Anopheles bellator TaxID=139047 RepID=UPI00264761AE|nr:DIS3-like exonuclease 2 [Anopheles bellator]